MLRRKITDTLVEWKNRPHKCLLVKGQRQVGKTFSITEFARANYDSYVEYDLIANKSSRRIFEGDLEFPKDCRTPEDDVVGRTV